MTSDTKLPSSTHLRCLLVALLDVLNSTPASAPRRRLSAPSNTTWYEQCSDFLVTPICNENKKGTPKLGALICC
jgi:hypothetical protein